jgi:hypothetical protein
MMTTFNLTVLSALIKDGYFDHPFWTRSLRSMFIVPPFAIVIALVIFLIHSISTNFSNIKFIMTKRKD